MLKNLTNAQKDAIREEIKKTNKKIVWCAYRTKQIYLPMCVMFITKKLVCTECEHYDYGKALAKKFKIRIPMPKTKKRKKYILKQTKDKKT